MTDQTPLDRRRFVRLAGSAASIALVAGCGGPGQGDNGTDAGAQTEAGPDEGVGGGGQGGGSREGEEGSQQVEEWLSETDNYSGVVDNTDVNRAAVAVGAPGNDGNNVFDLVAIRISPGMTVRWEWTSDGTHTVVERDGAFNSGNPTGNSDEVYEFDFEGPGTYLYNCERHEGRGMKGAVVVGEGDDGGGGGNESDGQSEGEGTGYDDGNQSDETGS